VSEPASVSEPPERPVATAEQIPISDRTPSLLEDILEAYEQNDHTIGWLIVPGTNIDDVILFHPTDNFFYERRGFDRQYSFDGVFWADRRSVFGPREEMGVNTCIYGHAFTDDADHSRFNDKFGQLAMFRDEEFAREHPYIFFSTKYEDMAWEIFAVFIANADNPNLPYNRNIVGDETHQDFVDMVRNEVLPRSKWVYDVEIKDDDKFLVLSACFYEWDDGPEFNRQGFSTGYPNTFFRYAIMARLVHPDEEFREYAVIEFNEDIVIDPDGRWAA